MEGVESDNNNSINEIKMNKDVPQCRKCQVGSADPKCEICKANSYFEESNNTCQICPDFTFSYPNSIGQASCKPKPSCKQSDYVSYKNNICITKSDSNISQLVEIFKNQPFNCDENSGLKLPVTATKYIPCSECAKGQFRKQINPMASSNNSGIYSTVCEFCPFNTYNDDVSSTGGSCKKCEDGYTPRLIQISEGNFYQDTLDQLFFNNKNWVIYNNNLAVKLKDMTSYTTARLDQNITITESTGYIEMKIALYVSYRYNFTIKMTDYKKGNVVYSTYLQTRQNYTLETNLPQGSYKVSLELREISPKSGVFSPVEINANEAIITIDSLLIRNSLLGGGYKCSKCPSNTIVDKFTNSCAKCPKGTEINPSTNACVACKDGYFNDGNLISASCAKCPDFMTSNSNKDGCILIDVVQNKNASLRYIINDLLDTEQKMLCDSGDSLCYDKFLGPISGESDLFFLSYKEKSNPNFSDFSYENYSQDSNNPSGFVFSLKKGESHASQKTLINMGREISYLKLFSNRQGLAVKYSEGDVCKEDSMQKYSTILFIRCFKEFDSIYSVDSPKLLKKINNNCTNILEWKSRHGCSSCLKNEAMAVHVYIYLIFKLFF